MAQIAVAPFVLKDVILTIGTDSYEMHCSTAAFNPSSSVLTWQGLTPAAAFSDTTTPSWTCTLNYAQDWETANSLAQYLLANQNTSKVAVFKPRGATTGKPIFTATILIAPGPIGGDVNTVQVGTVTLGVSGAPVKTVAP